MQNFYLFRWLKDHSGLDPDILDTLKYELDKRIYYYGGHFSAPFERSVLEERLVSLHAMVKGLFLAYGKGQKSASDLDPVARISSNAYFTFNASLCAGGFAVSGAPWLMRRNELGDSRLYGKISAVRSCLESADFKEIISERFFGKIRELKSELKSYYLRERISALIVPFDMPFFERLAINIFRELGRSSFVSLHGLPGRYNAVDDNRADYLLVWGEKIKEYYVRAGVPESKIFVTGHPAYRAPQGGALRFSFEDVLVISKSMAGAQQSSEEILGDRGNLLLYLYSVRKALAELGVKRARLRLHPSESAVWYRRFIDDDFYVIDRAPLDHSLSRASLVIGPTSTVFVESLIKGVNYLVYEPALAGRDVMNYPLVPPFDGTERGVPVANDERGLAVLLKTRTAVTPEALSGFIRAPFDTSKVCGLLRPV